MSHVPVDIYIYPAIFQASAWLGAAGPAFLKANGFPYYAYHLRVWEQLPFWSCFRFGLTSGWP